MARKSYQERTNMLIYNIYTQISINTQKEKNSFSLSIHLSGIPHNSIHKRKGEKKLMGFYYGGSFSIHAIDMASLSLSLSLSFKILCMSVCATEFF
jgi:hypothetical protein